MENSPQEGYDANMAVPVPDPASSNKTAEENLLSVISKQHGYTDDKDECISCGDNDSSDTALQCVFCRMLFHAVCKDATGEREMMLYVVTHFMKVLIVLPINQRSPGKETFFSVATFV